MEYRLPLRVSTALVFNRFSRSFEKGMMRLKFDGSFPTGYKLGNSSGTWTKLNGLVNSLSIPRTAGVLTVILIMAGMENHSGVARGFATSPSSIQCHASNTQLFSAPSLR